jgi:hypothetical protein
MEIIGELTVRLLCVEQQLQQLQQQRGVRR